MADLSGYTPIYVRTNGNNTTGDGSLGAPYLTAQKAWDVAIATPSGNYVLDFGSGNFGGVTLSANWPARIAVRGVNSTASLLGGIIANGAAQVATEASYDPETNEEIPSVETTPPTNGFNIALVSDQTINLGSISSNGADKFFLPPDDPDYNNGATKAKNGGNITLTDCVCGSISSVGGAGVRNFVYSNNSVPGNNVNIRGGDGGDINLNNTLCSGITCDGGRSDNLVNSMEGHGSGVGGDVFLTNSACSGNISTNDSSATTLTYISGAPGDVSLTNSSCVDIVARTLMAAYPLDIITGGAPSNVTLNNSVCRDVDVSSAGTEPAGYYDGGSLPDGGTIPINPGNVTLVNSVARHIICSAGYVPASGSVGATGGTVTLTNSTCQNINVDGSSESDQGGDGGVVVLTKSFCNTILGRGGYSYIYGSFSTGASVTISDSEVIGNLIDVRPEILSAAGLGVGNGGTVTLTGYSKIPNSILGAASVDTTLLKKGRGVNGSNILGLI